MGGRCIQEAIASYQKPKNHMIYLFRKFNKAIVAAVGAGAWEMFSSNGDWKHKPAFLGAVAKADYDAIRQAVQEEFPIDSELTFRVNTGDDRQADREMRVILAKRVTREKELLEALAAKADKTQVPANMDLVNKHQIPREYHGMARNLMSHE